MSKSLYLFDNTLLNRMQMFSTHSLVRFHANKDYSSPRVLNRVIKCFWRKYRTINIKTSFLKMFFCGVLFEKRSIVTLCLTLKVKCREGRA